MSEDEKREAGKKGGAITGRRIYEEGRGIFGMSEDEKREAGKKGGKRTYEKRIGMWGMSKEEWLEARRRAVRSKCQIPYDDKKRVINGKELTEREAICYLKGEIALGWEEITEQINFVFGNNRKTHQIKSLYNHYWKEK